MEIYEDNYDKTIDLYESERYITARIVNIFKTYDTNGIETVEKIYYPLVQCTDQFFDSTYETEYYETFINSSGRNSYCGEDPLIVLEGTRDSAVRKENHSYIIYEIQRCNDDLREETAQ